MKPINRVRDDLVMRQLDQEWVVFDPRAGRIVVLNLTAALVFSHLDGKHDREMIVDAVRESFADLPDRADVERDVDHVLAGFEKEGFLE